MLRHPDVERPWVKPGSVLDGRSEVERVAGQGGAGVVYRGHDRETGAQVAIKLARAAHRRIARRARPGPQGVSAREWVEHDPDFDSVRDDPRFQALVDKLS